jgi:hypothetical protein
MSVVAAGDSYTASSHNFFRSALGGIHLIGASMPSNTYLAHSE